ncbi:HYDIN protein, partial [Malurus elegans]|nr:HYDIN protein [Malurus elegans]
TKPLEKKETKPSQKKETKSPEKRETKSSQKKETKPSEKKETKSPEKKETKSPENKETKPPEKKKTKSPKKKKTKSPKKKKTKSSKKKKIKKIRKGKIQKKSEDKFQNIGIHRRFEIYESSQQNVRGVFSCWDRVQGIVHSPEDQREEKPQSPVKRQGQKKTSKPPEKVEKKPVGKPGGQKSLQSSKQGQEMESTVPKQADRPKHVGVPCFDIRATDPDAMVRMILKSRRLPTAEKVKPCKAQILSLPWLTPPFSLSLYAKNADAKDSSAKGPPTTGKAASKDKSPQENQTSTEGPKVPLDSSTTKPKSSSEAKKSTLQSASAPTEPTEPPRPKRCRWVVPAHDEVELKVLFRTTKPGKFERMLRFEILGSKRLYEVACSGVGLYPTISQNPRLVFPQWRDTMEDDEIIFKEYVISTKKFHFGPLLCGKSRDWYVFPAPEQA